VHRANKLLIVLCAASVSSVAIVVVPKVAAVAVPAALILILLSGYAVSSAIIGPRAPELPERVVASLGSSFAVVILGGLALNLAPHGLGRSTWVPLLAGAIAVAAIVRFLRTSESSRPTPRLPLPGPGAVGGGLLALAVATTCVAVIVGRAVPTAHKSDGYAVLWLLPGHTSAEVRVGVISDELQRTPYRLELWLGSHRIFTRPLTLTTGEAWSNGVVMPRGVRAGTVIKARLYLSSQPTAIYRDAHLAVQ
jgi:uncharacterized membrane protein